MSFLKHRTILALIFVLAVLVVVGLFYVPRLFVRTVSSQQNLQVIVNDFHAQLDFSLREQSRMNEVVNIFSDLFQNQRFSRVNLIFTDSQQLQKIYWMNSRNQMVNHLGFDVQVTEQSFDIYLYNNASALKESGWGMDKIEKENELLFLRALLWSRGLRGQALENQLKDMFLVLHQGNFEPLFNVSYAL